MPSFTAIAFLAGWVFIGFSALNITGIWQWDPRKVEAVTVVRSDIETLIDKLKPITREPSSSYYGVSVAFSGDGVAISLHLKNGSELKSKADTLSKAVQGLAAPNAEVQAVLGGWKPSP